MARTQDIVNSKTVTTTSSILQKRIEYDGDGNPVYKGVSPRGTSSAEQVWTITKYTWSTGNMVQSQTAFDSWDGRATANYA